MNYAQEIFVGFTNYFYLKSQKELFYKETKGMKWFREYVEKHQKKNFLALKTITKLSENELYRQLYDDWQVWLLNLDKMVNGRK